jgi:GT2 family glycosyltransferase
VAFSVSVVLVSWNSDALLPACLAALRAQTVPPLDIVAVDNGSRDGSVAWLSAQADIEVIANATNAGFAVANNQGIARARGDVVLLLNTDVVLAPRYIENCLRHFADANVGSVTGKLLRAEPGVIDSTGHEVYAVGWAQNRGEEGPDEGFDVAGEVFGVCAAAALYRHDALRSVAPDGDVLDPSYFAYIEDIDLDWRLRWLGWEARYEPSAVAVHHRSASGGRQSAAIMRHIIKNRILTVAKHYDGMRLLRNLPGLVAFTAAKTFDFARIHPSSVLGLKDAAVLLPQARRRRRWIKANRRANSADVYRWLLPFPWSDRVRRRLGTRRPAP